MHDRLSCGEATPQPELTFRLTVRPQSPHHAWRARLEAEPSPVAGQQQPLEFDNAMALLRHLVQLGLQEAGTCHAPGGLK